MHFVIDADGHKLPAGVAQTVVYKANIPVYLTGLVISVVLGSGVPPVVFALLWDRCTGGPHLLGFGFIVCFRVRYLLHSKRLLKSCCKDHSCVKAQ